MPHTNPSDETTEQIPSTEPSLSATKEITKEKQIKEKKRTEKKTPKEKVVGSNGNDHSPKESTENNGKHGDKTSSKKERKKKKSFEKRKDTGTFLSKNRVRNIIDSLPSQGKRNYSSELAPLMTSVLEDIFTNLSDEVALEMKKMGHSEATLNAKLIYNIGIVDNDDFMSVPCPKPLIQK